jgi:AAA15 family ATPase/GTPase
MKPFDLPFSALAISGFRSVSDEGASLENISSLNFLCGQNNAGKSNLLAFIGLLCNNFAHGSNPSLQSTDCYRGGSGQISFSLRPNIAFFLNSTLASGAQKRFYEILGEKGAKEVWLKYFVDSTKELLDLPPIISLKTV